MRNSMTARCLCLTSIVTFWFWPFRNGYKNLCREIIIFGMRDLNIMAHEMFGNGLGQISPNAIWLVQLFTGHPILSPLNLHQSLPAVLEEISD
jgi:hypothetical protein